jgi:hypothetical protein
MVVLAALATAALALPGMADVPAGPQTSPDGTQPGAAERVDPGPVADVDGYVVIGGGTTLNNWPWNSSNQSCRFQMMYTPAELTQSGIIIEFGFENASALTKTVNNLTIKLCKTNVSVVTTDLNSNYGGATPETVYFAASRVVGTGVIGGYDTFQFRQPFDYDGTSNLLVEIVYNGCSANGPQCYYQRLDPVRRTWVWDWQGNNGVNADNYCYNARFFFRDTVYGHDVNPVTIVEPARPLRQYQAFTPTVRFHNSGANPESDIPVYYTIDSAGTRVYSAAETLPGTLQPDSSVTFSFAGPLTLGAKGIEYAVRTWTALPGDEYPANDTIGFTALTAGEPNRCFDYEWHWPTTRTGAGMYGCTGVQDTLVWVNLGFLAPWKTYILDFRTRAAVDSFDQYVSSGSYGYRDMAYIAAENAVYTGSESNRMDKIDATTKALITSYTVTGSPLPSVVRALAWDGDSLYTGNFGTYGMLKMSITGTNCHTYLASYGGARAPYGLGYDANRGIMYGFDGNYTGGIFQFDMPGAAWLLDTALPLPNPGPTSLFGGGEVFGDSFLLVTVQAQSSGGGTPTLHCIRILSGGVACEEPTLDFPATATAGPTLATGGSVTLRYAPTGTGPLAVTVFDVSGRQVLSRALPSNRAGTTRLDLGGLATGSYLVRLESNGTSSTRKLVVQR